MTSDKQIIELVKKLEPHFIGYTAKEKSLVNENGMELQFRKDWNEKTTVRGLHAGRNQSIGCSFEKPIEKIVKDIRRRLMPDYHKFFFERKRENLEREGAQKEQMMKLEALSSVVGGEIRSDYGRSSKFVYSENISIYERYNGRYEIIVDACYMDAMKLAKMLQGYRFYVSPPPVEED